MRENKLIQFYITNICNSHCKTCNIWKNKEQVDLSPEIVRNVVKMFPDADYVVGGGEARLHKNFDAILEEFKGTNYTLLTNGIGAGSIVKKIKKHDVKNVTISFDGVNHDFVRGTRYNTVSVQCLIDSLRGLGVNVKLSYTFSKYNMALYARSMEKIRSMGFDKVYFCLAQDLDILKGSDTGSVEVPISFIRTMDKSMLFDKDKELLRRIGSGEPLNRCSSQSNVHTINEYGDILFCQSFKSDIVIGNAANNEDLEMLKKYEDSPCIYSRTCKLFCQRRYDGYEE